MIVNKTLLNFAIKFGKIEEVKLLIQLGVDVNEPGLDGLTPLHKAAKHGHYKIIKILIKNAAVLDSTLVGPKQRGFTPLHLAVQKNYLNCAKLLLQYGASVSSKLKNVCHPICLAVFNNYEKMTSLLLEFGADINVRFNNQFFEEFEPGLYRSLWLDHDLLLLNYSILRDFKSMTKLLLTNGADVNLKSSLEKTTLMQAVEVSNQKLVKYLVQKRKANVNDRDIYGQPVLHFLMLNANRKDSMYNKKEVYADFDKIAILRKLWSYGADLNAQFPAGKERSSIIHYMIKYGFSLGVYHLLFYQKNLNFNEIDFTSIFSTQILNQDVTPDIENDIEYLISIKEKYVVIARLIVQRAIRDQMMGLPFDENLILKEPICDSYSIKRFKEKIKQYRDYISFYIGILKGIKIGDINITAWHLITCNMNELVKLMSNKIVRDFNILDLYENLKFDIPEFISLLKYRLRIAKKRKQLLEDCAEIIFNLLFPYLPYDCSKNIANNFSNPELIFLHPNWTITDDDDLCITDDDEDSADL